MEKTGINIKLVIFSVISGKLEVFMVGKKLPGGKLQQNKSLDESAAIIFRKNINIVSEEIYSEQLYTFSYPKEKKQKEISVVYYFLVPEHKIYSKDNNWQDIDDINIDKSDREIVFYAAQRLRWKIEYTNVVYSLLPTEFTFSQLQSSYEAILDKTLDKRNFRKKILSLRILKDTGHIKKLGKARPAEMFTFTKRKLAFVEIL